MIGYETGNTISAWLKSQWFHLSNKAECFKIAFKLPYEINIHPVGNLSQIHFLPADSEDTEMSLEALI